MSRELLFKNLFISGLIGLFGYQCIIIDKKNKDIQKLKINLISLSKSSIVEIEKYKTFVSNNNLTEQFENETKWS